MSAPRAGFLRRLYLTLRTEHTTPGKLGAAVGVGVFVGCSPFWGLHLAMSVVLATVLRLNRVLVYAVASFANPLTAPALIFGEVQIGHLLLRGSWLALSFSEIEAQGVRWLFADFVAGGLFVGAVLGTALGLVVRVVARGSELPGAYAPIVDTVVLRYLAASIRDAEGVRRSLVRNPVYPWLLEDRAFLAPSRILDLGCGRALPATLGIACGADEIPGRTYRGVDLSRRYVDVAREACGAAAGHSIEVADLRDFDPPPADLVLLVNVLRFLPVSGQDALLRRLAKAMPPGARLLVREVDAAAGWRFRLLAAREAAALLLPGRARHGLHYRRAEDLRNAIVAAGFSVRDVASARTARARILLEATVP